MRLDRAMASADWMSLYPHASLTHETGASSDHCPIRLQMEPANPMQIKQKLFRYELYWEKHAEFSSSLEGMWTNVQEGQTDTQMSCRYPCNSGVVLLLETLARRLKTQKGVGHFTE